SRSPLACVVERRKGRRDMSMYEIRVRGRLDAHWAGWSAGLTLAYEVLRGALADEAALPGVLSKITGLTLHVVSVNAMDTGDATSEPSAGTGREPAHWIHPACPCCTKLRRGRGRKRERVGNGLGNGLGSDHSCSSLLGPDGLIDL